MAEQDTIIRKIRLRVKDPNPPPDGGDPKYDNQYYIDAIDFGLQKLSHDFSSTVLWDISTLPDGKEFLLIKLATIEMCYVRGSESTDPTEESVLVDEVKSIDVPNLKIAYKDGKDEKVFQGPAYWTKLAASLQSEYDGELPDITPIDDGAKIVSSQIMRTSLRTGKLGPYPFVKRMIMGITSVAYDDVSTLTVVWEPIYSEHLNHYEIWIKKTGVANSDVLLTSIYDNHDYEIDIDKVLAVGEWKVYMFAVDNHDLKGKSSELLITVS